MFERLLGWIGYGLCHQLPERSFFGAGLQVPVCARDTGIYVGFVLCVALISVIHRGERPRGFPPPAAWAVMGALFLVFGWDGVSSYGGFRETTNAIRLATGLGMGFSAAAVLTPILNDVLWRNGSSAKLLTPVWRFIVWVVAIPLSWLAVWFVFPLTGRVYPSLVAVAILMTLTVINLAIVGMLPAFDRRASSLRDLVIPGLLSVTIAVAEIWLAAMARGALLQWIA